MRRLGDLELHPVAFGAMNLSIEGRPSRADAIATVRAARDAGANLFDTADVYGLSGAPHHNEMLLAEALGGDLPIATKGGVKRRGDVWMHCGDPAWLTRACEASLLALGRESIPLYQLHAVDDRVPIEDSIGALVQLRERGLIERIGVSNVDANQLERARREATIVSVQNEASPFVAPEPEVLAICERDDITFLAYAPMGGWRAGETAHLAPLQQETSGGRTPFETIVAWLLAASPVIVPVCGASTPANARSSVSTVQPLDAAAARRLTDAFWAVG